MLYFVVVVWESQKGEINNKIYVCQGIHLIKEQIFIITIDCLLCCYNYFSIFCLFVIILNHFN